MRGPTVVGGGSLIGYNSEQGDRSVAREAKDGAQGEYPHLTAQTEQTCFRARMHSGFFGFAGTAALPASCQA